MKLKNYINRHNKTSRKYTICNKNNGFWESNDNRGIYADEQEEGSSNNGGSECVGSYPVGGYTRADGTEETVTYELAEPLMPERLIIAPKIRKV